jgi:hypothetical protein
MAITVRSAPTQNFTLIISTLYDIISTRYKVLQVAVFFVHNFSLPLFATTVYFYTIIQFHLYQCVKIYLNWLQEQFCNLSLYTLHIVPVQ